MESPNGSKRHMLEPKQVEFFRNGKIAIQRLNDQMNGALQMICTENELQGSKISLSEDTLYIVVEE